MSDVDSVQMINAESAARLYVMAVPHSTSEARIVAFEDYVAGYLAAPLDHQSDINFVIKQLEQLIDLAQREGEFYSLSVARYTLQFLTSTKNY